MKIVTLDESLEKKFRDYINRDPAHYYFFIFDWTQRRDESKVLMAMEGENIRGLMLVYRDAIIQLRGDRETVRALLDSFCLDKVELQAPLDCEDLVLQKYKPVMKFEMVQMRLLKGEEDIQVKHKPVRLTTKDAVEVAELLRKADTEIWGEMTTEMLKKSMEDGLWLGIKRDGKIVSVGNTRFTDFGCNIGAIATHEQYRNKGYATSMVSALVKEILSRSSTALIHVRSTNAPAIRAYSKVGYKPYKSYFLMRGEKIKT